MSKSAVTCTVVVLLALVGVTLGFTSRMPGRTWAEYSKVVIQHGRSFQSSGNWRRHVCAGKSDVDDEGDVASANDAQVEELEQQVEESTGESSGAPLQEEEDPMAKAIREMEAKLAAEIAQLETQLRSNRLSLSKLQDQVSESGKNGYFIVQAQVAEFLKKNEAEQKSRVARNKREFVVNMLDVVDGFRKLPLEFPPETEREQNIHKNFGAVVNGILMVFDKYGFKEISYSEGDPIDLEKMEVGELKQDGAPGVVLSTIRTGWIDPDGFAVRKALISANIPAAAQP